MFRAVNFYSHMKYLHWREVIRRPRGSLNAISIWLQPTFSNWQATFTTQPRTSNNPTAASHSSHFKQARLSHRAPVGVDAEEPADLNTLVSAEMCLVVAGRGAELLQHVCLQLLSNFANLKQWADRLCDSASMQRRQEVLPIHAFVASIRSESATIIPGADQTRVSVHCYAFFHIWDTSLLPPPAAPPPSLSLALWPVTTEWAQHSPPPWLSHPPLPPLSTLSLCEKYLSRKRERGQRTGEGNRKVGGLTNPEAKGSEAWATIMHLGHWALWDKRGRDLVGGKWGKVWFSPVQGQRNTGHKVIIDSLPINI